MSQEPDYNELWLTLCGDEQYAGLCAYIQTKMRNLQSRLTEFKASVHDDIPPEACGELDDIMASVCHPPPGC